MSTSHTLASKLHRVDFTFRNWLPIFIHFKPLVWATSACGEMSAGTAFPHPHTNASSPMCHLFLCGNHPASCVAWLSRRHGHHQCELMSHSLNHRAGHSTDCPLTSPHPYTHTDAYTQKQCCAQSDIHCILRIPIKRTHRGLWVCVCVCVFMYSKQDLSLSPEVFSCGNQWALFVVRSWSKDSLSVPYYLIPWPVSYANGLENMANMTIMRMSITVARYSHSVQLTRWGVLCCKPK